MVPLVIRFLENRWDLVGDCYVHGMMHGEAYSGDRYNVLWIVYSIAGNGCVLKV